MVFQSWDKNYKKSVSRIEIDAEKEIFTCWICKKYPVVANEINKVTEGCSMWHRNPLQVVCRMALQTETLVHI